MTLAQAGGGPDALVGAGWRHANVGDDDVGGEFVDEVEEFFVRAGDARHREVVLGLEQPDDRFATK